MFSLKLASPAQGIKRWRRHQPSERISANMHFANVCQTMCNFPGSPPGSLESTITEYDGVDGWHDIYVQQQHATPEWKQGKVLKNRGKIFMGNNNQRKSAHETNENVKFNFVLWREENWHAQLNKPISLGEKKRFFVVAANVANRIVMLQCSAPKQR